MSGEDDGIFRPVPRRPFDLNINSPTPPDDDSAPPSPNPNDLLFANGQFLDPRGQGQHGQQGEGDSLSRTASILNLTTSTLFGIYSPTTASGGRGSLGGYYYNAAAEADTPWDAGAQTPAKRGSVDELTYELMRERSSLLQRRSTQKKAPPTGPAPSRMSTVLARAARAALLFGLGMGYGALVSRLQDEPGLVMMGESMGGIVGGSPDYDWRGLVFWGAAGVTLGMLLPWFDGVWDEVIGREDGASRDEGSPGTDWALVVRSIGAFAGIVFAIRKLPWASTMQVSLTLALVNPFLWYLIDRSISGFLLSSAVGVTGSAILMGLNPDMMPAPAHAFGAYRNGSSGAAEPLVLGGLARKETVETGIWMLSVLFCSCVCFGNIGRRLALSRSARGRWGGLR